MCASSARNGLVARGHGTGSSRATTIASPPTPASFMDTKKDLWLRLKSYHFYDLVPAHLTDRVAELFGRTDASTRAFANKVAKKHGWSTHFARRAVDEYKKFVFLGVVTEVSVTPSKAIDVVWHEHLLFTRAYRDFCRDVLGRDFDHHPELLPTDEQTELFAAQYDATLARYHTEFHVVPPADIWGTPKFKTDGTSAKKADGAIADGGGSSSGGGDVPLYSYFSTSGEASYMPEFGGGGGFGGAGGSDSWGSHDSTSGDSGSASGSSDSGSGCSSSCGGGCGGGD